MMSGCDIVVQKTGSMGKPKTLDEGCCCLVLVWPSSVTHYLEGLGWNVRSVSLVMAVLCHVSTTSK